MPLTISSLEPRRCCAVAVLVLLTSTAACADAQARPRVTALLDSLRAESVRAPSHGTAYNAIASILMRSETRERARGDSLLKGLEGIASSAATRQLQSSALELIALSARAPSGAEGAVTRLRRVYDATEDQKFRYSIVAVVPRNPSRATLAFLEHVALDSPATTTSGPSFGDENSVPRAALQSLLSMGDEGKAILRRLNEQGRVRDNAARVYLDALSRNGHLGKP